MSETKFLDIMDFNPPRKISKDIETSFIDMAALDIYHKKIKTKSLKKYSSGSRFQNGDTLFARITPCLENGKTAKVDILATDEIGHGSTEFIILAAKEPYFDEEYVYYLSLLPSFRKYAESKMEGTSGRQRVSWQSLAEFEYSFPAPEIRKKAGEALALFDNKIELNNQINETLEKMAKALFKSWFVDFEPVLAKAEAVEAGNDPELAAMQVISGKSIEELERFAHSDPEAYQELAHTVSLFPSEFVESELGMIPKGWEVKSFKQVINIFDNLRKPLSKIERMNIPGDYPYYGAASRMDSVGGYLFDGTYVLLAEDGSVKDQLDRPVTQYVWGRFWVNNHAHILTGKDDVSTEQILLFLKRLNISPYITGAVQMKLNQKNLQAIPFLYSSKAINKSYGKYVTFWFEQYQINHDEKVILEKIRDALLPKLLSGEIELRGEN